MLETLINKVLMILLFMSILNIIRHTYYFIQSMVLSTEEEPMKYKIGKDSLLFLSISIGYILTVIFTGITL